MKTKAKTKTRSPDMNTTAEQTKPKGKRALTTVNVAPLYVDLPTAAAVVSLSISGIEELVRQGSFPKPRLLSPRRTGYLLRELQDWAENRPISNLPPPENTNRKKSAATATG